MLSYRSDSSIEPPKKAKDVGLVVDPKQFETWAQLRFMDDDETVFERKMCDLLCCSRAEFRKLLRKEPYKSLWRRGPVETEFKVKQQQIKLMSSGKGTGAVAMTMFLGRNYLGQIDRRTENGKGDGDDNDFNGDTVYRLNVSLKAPRPPHAIETTEAEYEDITGQDNGGPLPEAVDVPAAGNSDIQPEGQER
jgi:hypothetical protein